MNRFKEDEVVHDNQAQPAGDGIDRRNFLGCMAWAGTGLLWTMAAGVPTSKLLATGAKGGATGVGKIEEFSFVQISDSHIGFNKGANPDVTRNVAKGHRQDQRGAGRDEAARLHDSYRRHHPELEGFGVRYRCAGD